jgi:hypothetical protein
MELLIAASIFAVIAVTLYSVFSGGIRVYRRQEKVFKYSHNVNLALDKMAGELRNAINYSQPAQAAGSAGETGKLKFAGDDKKMSFITVRGNDIINVDYFFVSTTDRRRVLKKKVSYQKEGFEETGRPEMVMIEGLEGLLFEYAYKEADKDSPPEWQREWGKETAEQKPKIPSGVRITLEFKESGQEKAEILRKTVFIATGTLEEQKGL